VDHRRKPISPVALYARLGSKATPITVEARRDCASEETAGVDADVTSRGWHTLTVRAVDNQFTARRNRGFTAFDKTRSKSGRIALWTEGDSVTRFDNIAITALSTSEERYRRRLPLTGQSIAE
jgi:hypothetical protein